MSIELFADLYVTYIEPALKIFAAFMLVMAVIYVLQFIKDPKRQIDIATQFFQFINRAIVAVFLGVFHGVTWICKFIWRTLSIIFGTLRDFFISRI